MTTALVSGRSRLCHFLREFFVIQIEAQPGGCLLALVLSRNEQIVISRSLSGRDHIVFTQLCHIRGSLHVQEVNVPECQCVKL